MDLAIIVTYRCNSRCSMCYAWQNPTSPAFEIPLDILAKLPSGFDTINLTGGEPSLRTDLLEICTLLRPKTRILEISTNGLRTDPLEAVLCKYPDTKIRISIEGIADVNDSIRGERHGYDRKIQTMNRLLQTNASDLGFATTVQDENANQILPLYKYCQQLGVEFATSSVHNGFQFHKNDNSIYDRTTVAGSLEALITEMLKSWDIKTWFRAYLNLGLMRKILGLDRPYACPAASGGLFIDPWCDVYPCNVRNDLLVGNLRNQSWNEITNGSRISEVRTLVAGCGQNCWMAGVAKGAMRMPRFHRLPRRDVLIWVLFNKCKLVLGGHVRFLQYVDYSAMHEEKVTTKRQSYLGRQLPVNARNGRHPRYSVCDSYFNR